MTFGSKTTTSTSTCPEVLAKRVDLKTQQGCTAPHRGLHPPQPPRCELSWQQSPARWHCPFCSDPQVFISCPVPTQIIHKVKCRLPFRVVTNLSTLSLSSVIHTDINEETNMFVTEEAVQNKWEKIWSPETNYTFKTVLWKPPECWNQVRRKMYQNHTLGLGEEVGGGQGWSC